jgi:hypothetical protein
MSNGAHPVAGPLECHFNMGSMRQKRTSYRPDFAGPRADRAIEPRFRAERQAGEGLDLDDPSRLSHDRPSVSRRF